MKEKALGDLFFHEMHLGDIQSLFEIPTRLSVSAYVDAKFTHDVKQLEKLAHEPVVVGVGDLFLGSGLIERS